MTSCIAPSKSKSLPTDLEPPKPHRRLPGMAIGMLLGALLSSQVLAGGADVSDDEIYADGVTLTTDDNSPLDIDNDGNTDLAIAANRAAAAEASRYYLGNGDGTFGAPVVLTPGNSSRLLAADFNMDGFVDLVQGRRDLTNLLYLNDMLGGVGPDDDISADALRTLGMAIGDLDNDGDLDIVTGNGRASGSGAHQPNRFYLNDMIPGGTATFTGADIAADADNTRSIELADLDGDGDLDVVVANDHTTANSNRVYLNQFVESGNTTVSFGAGIDFGNADDLTTEIRIGDLDGDTLPDIVALNAVVDGVSSGISQFFLNLTTAGVFALDLGTNVSADTDRTNGGVLADFDGDGDLDLAVANFVANDPSQSSRNRLYLNQFIESGSTAVSFSAGLDISDDEHMSHELAAADLNGDGHIDIVAGNRDDVVGGVPGRDRRYLNNGSADPFTNVAPLIDGQDPLETGEQTDLTIVPADLTVTDPDNAFPNDFTLTVQAGTNYSVAGNTITPDANFDGDLTVPVVVNDGTDDSDPFDLTVTVNDTENTAPTFTSTPITDADEGVAYSYDITATDPDISDTLAITAPTLPAWLTLTDNGDGTASLTGTPAAADTGDHAVSLQVTDSGFSALTDVQGFTITVTGSGGPNTAPSFTSAPVTAATEDTAYTYDVTTTDPDAGDTLTITAPTLPGWLTFTDNGDGTATLTGTPADTDVGNHDVTLEVSDGTTGAIQAYTIAVSAAQAGNTAPSFTSTPVTDATEGTAYAYDITAADADSGDTLTITGTTVPAWATLIDNGDGTATLAGTPAGTDVGDHAVALEVSDGTDVAVQNFTITVAAVGPPPVFPPPPISGGGSVGFLSLVALLAGGAVNRRRRRNTS